ncbi:MAG: AtpZ/AtpI family protein [Bacteroidales bacterium]|jgi:F0F1-type ATP synthase assembly protein I
MQNGKKFFSRNKLENEKRSLKDYARYSNLAFKLIAVILAAFFIGWQVDKWINTGFPIFTLIFSITGIILSLYLLIKDL